MEENEWRFRIIVEIYLDYHELSGLYETNAQLCYFHSFRKTQEKVEKRQKFLFNNVYKKLFTNILSDDAKLSQKDAKL